MLYEFDFKLFHMVEIEILRNEARQIAKYHQLINCTRVAVIHSYWKPTRLLCPTIAGYKGQGQGDNTELEQTF